jgi:hypothetical protein
MRHTPRTTGAFVLSMLCGLASAQAQPQPASGGTDVVHAVAGTVTKVDAAAKTVAIKTANGTVEVLKFTDKTTIEGTEAAGKAVATTGSAAFSATKEGSDVIAHYVVRGSEKTATGVHEVGKGTLKVSKGVVTAVDSGAKTVSVKTADGAVETYHMSEKAGVETSRGVVKGAEATGQGLKVGAEVTVSFTESTGRKIAHLFAGATAPAKK